jgi:hypothetical protein
MSDDASPRPEPLDVNPFEPTVPRETHPYPRLRLVYWTYLSLFAIFSLVASFSPDLVVLGIFGVSTSIFAGLHGYFYQRRMAARLAAGFAETRVPDVALCFLSLLFGGLATLAGVIAFLVTCIPTSLFVMGGGLVGLPPAIGWGTIWFVCSLMAILFAGWVIRRSLPRKPD